MNSAENILDTEDGGKILNLLNEYIIACKANGTDEKSKSSGKEAFPNLAGFCRFLNISTLELDELSKKFPKHYGRMVTILEDEALNSKLSPTIVSAYMKKRLDYDRVTASQSQAQMEIKFEHDIFEDGA